MRKKTFYILVLAGVLAVILSLIFINSGKRHANLAALGKSDTASGRDLINLGKKQEEEGRYLEAKTAYGKAMESSSNNEIINEAEKSLYALNMKILFSPVITEDSQKYVVVKGDSLAKIARQFGTTVELLRKSNQLTGDLIRPNMELKVSTAKYGIVIDKSQNILILKSNDQILKTYQVSTGKDNSTPLGSFKVMAKLVNPTWYSSGAVVGPDDLENILGSRWIGISKPGYGIHGTTQPETIGMHVTAGCIRMTNEDVEELYSIIPLDTEVTIVD